MVAPKKEKLAAAEGEYSELMTGLNQKKSELAAVEANLAALNAKLKEMQASLQGGLGQLKGESLESHKKPVELMRLQALPGLSIHVLPFVMAWLQFRLAQVGSWSICL